MKKNTRENKNRVMREVKLGTEAIFDLSAKAEKVSYTNDLGTTVEEEPGKYRGALSQAMLGDMFRFGIFLHSMDEDLSKEFMKVRKVIEERDLTIRRMFDDRKGNRPLSRYSFENSKAIVESLMKVKEADIYDNPTCERYKDKLASWTKRILRQDVWAYSLECLESFDQSRHLADFRVFDDDGNIVYGIPESDATSVHLITSMQELLVRALVRLPVMSDELQDCMAKIELIDILVQAILSQDEEKIDFLAKCAEAAQEFKVES